MNLPVIKTNFSNLLAYTVVILIFAYFIFITVKPSLAQNNYVSGIIAALISTLSGIVGYYFGSSQGSQNKDATIANMANKSINPNAG